VICVDTSVWIEAEREPAGKTAHQLRAMVEDALVALAAPVRLELLAGVSRAEAARFATLAHALTTLVPAPETWLRAERLLVEAGQRGQRFGPVDVLVAAIAKEHALKVWSLDADFARMERLGFVELHDAA
jgi:predicted nucleic acid-binding protein